MSQRNIGRWNSKTKLWCILYGAVKQLCVFSFPISGRLTSGPALWGSDLASKGIFRCTFSLKKEEAEGLPKVWSFTMQYHWVAIALDGLLHDFAC